MKLINAPRKIYFLSDFADIQSNVSTFKKKKLKQATRWNAIRESRVRRGSDGRFGTVGKAASALTNTPSKKAAIATAGLLGIPAASYLAVRASYRNGMNESASLVKIGSKAVNVPTLGKSDKQITFAIGGFDGDSKSSFTLADGMKPILSDHHIAPIVQAEFNVKTTYKPGESISAYAVKQAKEMSRVFYETVSKQAGILFPLN